MMFWTQEDQGSNDSMSLLLYIDDQIIYEQLEILVDHSLR